MDKFERLIRHFSDSLIFKSTACATDSYINLLLREISKYKNIPSEKPLTKKCYIFNSANALCSSYTLIFSY